MIRPGKPAFRRRMKGLMLKYMHRMITCVEFENFVLRYLDDELPQKQKTVFELHLKLCAQCRDYLAAYQRSMEISRAVLDSSNDPSSNDPGAQDVPEDLVKAVLEALEQDDK